MRPLIIKPGTASEGLRAQRQDYDRFFADGLGWPMSRFEVLDATTDPTFPDPRGVDGVFITGSPMSVHDHHPWSVRLGEWLAAAIEAGVPVLGVCYGHQLVGDIFGGEVGLNPRGREIGVIEVEVVEDPLFAGLPPRFPVFLTHCDAVNVAPPNARVLGRTTQTPVAAMAIGPRCRTLQWHPEFDAHILRHIIRERTPLIDAEREPGAAARILEGVVGLHTGPIILRNFVEHYLRG